MGDSHAYFSWGSEFSSVSVMGALSATDPASNVAFMAHIDLQNRLPGILGLLRFRPATAEPLMGLAEVLLRGESPLSRGERELIAADVSKLKVANSASMPTGRMPRCNSTEDGIWSMPRDRSRRRTDLGQVEGLLRIAIAVAAGGKRVTPELIERLRPLMRAMSRSTTLC